MTWAVSALERRAGRLKPARAAGSTRNGSLPRAESGLVHPLADAAAVDDEDTIGIGDRGEATGDVACWDLAYAGAERHLLSETAGRLVASLTILSRTIRAERTSDWHFMPATCCRVTSDEEAVLRLLAAAREGERRTIARAASSVTGAPGSPSLETAAKVVGRTLDDIVDVMQGFQRPVQRPPIVH